MAEVRYTLKDGYTGAVAALSLATALLRKSKANTWAQLTAELEDPESVTCEKLKQVILTDEQVELLDSNDEVLRYLKLLPPVQVALCSCGLPYLLAGGAAPTSCTADEGCTGTPVKPSAATIAKPEKATAAPGADSDDTERP